VSATASRNRAARLPLAELIDRLRAVVEATSGTTAGRNARTDLTWAKVDQARSLRADPDAWRLAVELAEQGDEQAIEALELAEEVGPAQVPRSAVMGPDHLNGPQVEPLRLDHLIDALAEQRRHGVPFDDAWARARSALSLTTGEVSWALSWSRDAWRAAYCRTKPPRGYTLSPWSDEEPPSRVTSGPGLNMP
jgi:hypothetical protein